MTSPGDVADVVGTELERVARRWQQLPLDHALGAFPGALATAQAVSDETTERAGMPQATLPDLGPGVIVDQLRVVVHDAREAGVDVAWLGARLTELRRALP